MVSRGLSGSLSRALGWTVGYGAFTARNLADQRLPSYRRQRKSVARGMQLPPAVEPTHRRHGVWAVTMVKNERDIIAQTIRHLFQQGVEGVLVADNGSTDDTLRILERLRGEFNVHVAIDSEPAYYQSVKMSLLADWARRSGARWVVPFDADEFWWAPEGRLADWLADQEANVVRASIYNAFPSVGESGWALDMRAHHLSKVAFRAMRGARIEFGNHSVRRPGRWADGIVITHVPWRSFDQFQRKLRNGAVALSSGQIDPAVGSHWRVVGRRTNEQLQGLWNDLREGLDNPEIGWSPFGELRPINDPFTTNPLVVVPRASDVADAPLTLIYRPRIGPEGDAVAIMARCAAEALPVEVVMADAAPATARTRMRRALLRATEVPGDCLILAQGSADLVAMLSDRGLRGRCGRVVVWMAGPPDPAAVDLLSGLGASLLHVFFTAEEVESVWTAAFPGRASPLALGVDVLDMKGRPERGLDLLRIGAPATAWADDAAVARCAQESELRFAEDVPTRSSVVERRRTLWAAMASSKFTLWANVVCASASVRVGDTFDAPWMESLGSGATVIGVPPAGRSASGLLWEGALIELESDELVAALARVGVAAKEWTPKCAVRNRRMALERLDFRWRFAEILHVFGRTSTRLGAELARVEAEMGLLDGLEGS